MSTLKCENCGAARGPDDMFCESCGFDYITGSLPSAEEEQAPVVGSAGLGSAVPGKAQAPESASPGAVPTGAEAKSEPSAGTGSKESESGPESQSAAGLKSEPALQPSAGSESEQSASGVPAGSVPRLHLVVSVDRAQFDNVVKEGEVDFPDSVPIEQVFELPGTEFHIGRTSQSRAVHPDLDIRELTGDEAVSTRHAVLKVGPDKVVTITDVGSTNGTTVTSPDAEPIEQGDPVVVEPGAAIYVGAWTKLTILGIEDGPTKPRKTS